MKEMQDFFKNDTNKVSRVYTCAAGSLFEVMVGFGRAPTFYLAVMGTECPSSDAEVDSMVDAGTLEVAVSVRDGVEWLKNGGCRDFDIAVRRMMSEYVEFKKRMKTI
jgi:hypothetical protein